MWRSMLLAFLVAGAPVVAPAAKTCRVEQARYAMLGHPGFTAGFQALPKGSKTLTDVAFFFQSEATNRSFWFLFDRGSARYINMISTPDNPTSKGVRAPLNDDDARPLGEMHYLPADRGLKFSLTLPAKGQTAPAYILLPDLSEAMWYRAPEPREDVPLAIFKLSGCAA